MNSKNLNNPVASIIIPTFNRSKFIMRSINSALNQSIEDIEVIVVDDGSTDNTETIIREINDSRLVYIKLDKNKGAPTARNIGIKKARGEYISFLDSDDELLSTKIEKQLLLLTRSKDKAVIAYCGYYIVDNNSTRVISEIIPKHKGDISNIIIENNCIGSPTPLVHRDCFVDSDLFDETLESCQDWDLWIRLSENYEFDFVPECLAKYYVHGNQITASIKKKISARESLINKYKNRLSKNKTALSWHLRRLGFYMCLDGQRQKGKLMIFKSIKVDPFNWRGYVHIFLLFISMNLYKEIVMKISPIGIGDMPLHG